MEGSSGCWRIFTRPGFKPPEKAVLTQLEDVNPVSKGLILKLTAIQPKTLQDVSSTLAAEDKPAQRETFTCHRVLGNFPNENLTV